LPEPKTYRFVVVGLEDVDGIRKHVFRVRLAAKLPDGLTHKLVLEGSGREIFDGMPKGSNVQVVVTQTQTTLTGETEGKED